MLNKSLGHYVTWANLAVGFPHLACQNSFFQIRLWLRLNPSDC